MAALEVADSAAAMLAAKAAGEASSLEVALAVLTREVGLVAKAEAAGVGAAKVEAAKVEAAKVEAAGAEAVAESAAHGSAALGGARLRQAPAPPPAPGTRDPHTSHSHLQSRVRLGGLDDSLSE